MQEATATSTSTPVNAIPFQFTGKTGEFFGIWIVNILLTILTLGIYTAWAKVRTKRYFYGNTLLDNTPFDYLANPIAILKGWLIAVGFMMIFSVTTSFFPLSQPIFMLVLFLAIPWLVIRSMMFRARNTAYRNLRFTFNGQYGEAIRVFIGLALLMPFTLGLIYPYIIYRRNKFLVENSGYGTSSFSFNGKAKEFYMIYLMVFLLMIGLGVVFSLALVPTFTEMAQEGQTMDDATVNGMMMSALGGFYVAFFLFYFVMFAYLDARISNLVWNNTKVEQHSFSSKLRARDLIWIYFSNLLAIIFTFGLLIPWTKIRLARYRFSKMQLVPAGNLNSFIQAEEQKSSALGEEMGEVFDVDIGL